MPVHLEPVVYVLRLYVDGGSYAAGSPYVTSATVQVFVDTAYVSGLAGVMTRQHYRDICDALAGVGCTTMVTMRNGTLKTMHI